MRQNVDEFLEQHRRAELGRRREVIDLPMHALRRHGRIDPPAGFGGPARSRVSVGPDGTVAALWTSPGGAEQCLTWHDATGSVRHLVEIDRPPTERVDAQPFGDDILVATSRVAADEPNAEVWDASGRCRTRRYVGHGFGNLLTTGERSVWLGFIDEVCYPGEGLGGPHGLIRLGPDLRPEYRFTPDTGLPKIFDCHALNVEGETAWIAVYDSDRLVEVRGNTARDRGALKGGVFKLLHHAGVLAQVGVGGLGVERDLVLLADLGPDDLVPRDQGACRLVMPNGVDVPLDAEFTCRGPDLHVLVRGTWYRTDLDALVAGP